MTDDLLVPRGCSGSVIVTLWREKISSLSKFHKSESSQYLSQATLVIWGLDKFKDQAIETRHIMDCEEEKNNYLDSKMVVQDRGDQYICAKRWPYTYGYCLPLWALKAYCTPHKSFLDKPSSLLQLNTPPPFPLYPVHVFNALQSTPKHLIHHIPLQLLL